MYVNRLSFFWMRNTNWMLLVSMVSSVSFSHAAVFNEKALKLSHHSENEAEYNFRAILPEDFLRRRARPEPRDSEYLTNIGMVQL